MWWVQSSRTKGQPEARERIGRSVARKRERERERLKRTATGNRRGDGMTSILLRSFVFLSFSFPLSLSLSLSHSVRNENCKFRQSGSRAGNASPVVKRWNFTDGLCTVGYRHLAPLHACYHELLYYFSTGTTVRRSSWNFEIATSARFTFNDPFLSRRICDEKYIPSVA